jgi:DNA-binding NtrC family response regulator
VVPGCRKLGGICRTRFCSYARIRFTAQRSLMLRWIKAKLPGAWVRERFATRAMGRASCSDVLAQVEMVAATDCIGLLQGETGTGKEVVAELIHNHSPRRMHPLVKVNCAAIPSDLLESELFGHERGAFAGAMTQRLGRFELADKGTLFLNEVGDIPLELQPKLLWVSIPSLRARWKRS